MTVIPEKVRKALKKPLGRLHHTPSVLKKMKNRRIIAVGDESTIVLLKNGIKPHLAVFDFRIKRKKITKEKKKFLLSSFKKIRNYRNKPGTLSDYLLKNAGRLIKDGGAILIEGEEDLTALAFILNAGEKDVIVYGQPDKGLVVVEPEKAKKRLIKLLSSAASTFRHEIKGH